MDFLIQIEGFHTKLTEKTYINIFTHLAEPLSKRRFDSLLGQYLAEPSTTQLVVAFLKKHELFSHPLTKQACIAVCLTDNMDFEDPKNKALYEIAIHSLIEENADGSRLYQISKNTRLRDKLLKWLVRFSVLDSSYGDLLFNALTKRVLDPSYRPHRLISPLSYLLCELPKFPAYRHLLSHPKLGGHPRHLNYLFDILDRESLGEKTSDLAFDEELLTHIEVILATPDKHCDLNTLTATGLPLIAAAAQHGTPTLLLKMMKLGADITLPYHWSSLHYQALYSKRRQFKGTARKPMIELEKPKTLRDTPRCLNPWETANAIQVSARPGLAPLKSSTLRQTEDDDQESTLLHLTHGHHFERGALIRRHGFFASPSSKEDLFKYRLSTINRQVISALPFGESNRAQRLFETGLTSFAISYRNMPLYQVKTKDKIVHAPSAVYYDDGFFPANKFAGNFVYQNSRLLRAFFTTQVASYYKAGNCETQREMAFMSLFFGVDQSDINTISLVVQETDESNHFFVLINAGSKSNLSGCHELPDSSILLDPYLDVIATKKDILRQYFSNYYGQLTQKLIISPGDYTVREKVELLLVLSRIFFAYAVSHDEPIQQLPLGFAAPLLRHAALDLSAPEYPVIKGLLSHMHLLEQCVAYHATLMHPGSHPFIYGDHSSPFPQAVKALYWQYLTMKDLTFSKPIFDFEVGKVGPLNRDVILKKCHLLKHHIDMLQGDEEMSDKLAHFIDIRACSTSLRQVEAKPLYFSADKQKEFSKLLSCILPWVTQHIEKQDKVSEAELPPQAALK